MSLNKTFATTYRVLRQLSHDLRTVVLLFLVPPILLTVFKYVFQDTPNTFNYIAPILLGIFPMVMMFLVTSIVTLRERTTGTLDRLMTMPMSKMDFVFGYAIAFSAIGLIQSLITSGVMFSLLGVTVLGGILPTIITAIFASFLGTTLGLCISAFATSEFQAIQFMPAFIFPQILVCGLFVARDAMAQPLQWFANVMPLTYSVDAIMQVTKYSDWSPELTMDLMVVLMFGIVALILGSITIRRRD